MTAVMIGVDPHKGSHTAVAIDAEEEPLGKLRIRASASQAQRLVTWAAAWPERTWAVEGAGGLGHLLAQQLVAAGERVLDVQPKLGARVRLLATGASNKNDPNDALSVAVAALRSKSPRPVSADDQAAVLRVWSRRHRDLGRAKNQVACRLHAVLCELVPGGVPEEITAAQATRILDRSTPSGAAGQARGELAAELLDDMRHTDTRIRESKKKLAVAVRASGTSLTEIFGVGPVIAATVIGDAGDIARFASRDHFAAYNGTAPIEVSSGNRKVHRLSLRGNRRINHAIHMAAITQIRYPHSGGRAYYDKKVAEGKTGVPLIFRTADPYRIVSRRDGIKCLGNIRLIRRSSAMRRPGWSWRRRGLSPMSLGSLRSARPAWGTGYGRTGKSTRKTSRRCSYPSGPGCAS
jgi:transposase